MPAVSRFLIRCALLHLLAGTTIGALLLASKGVPASALVGVSWRGAHVEMLVTGFLVQFALGVAQWILPRDADRTPSALPAWAAGALLNAGVLLCAAGATASLPALEIAGRLPEAAAVAIFLGHAWPRVRAARRLTDPGASSGRSR